MRQNTYSFIIRIWHESVDERGNAIIWRGSIEHVNSGKRFHFDSINELIEFIKQEGGLNGIEPPRWWRSFLAWIRFFIIHKICLIT